MSNTAFRIKNKFVVGLASWLSELNLYGKDSRERTKFVRLLVEQYQEIEASRKEIVDRYAKRDEKDEIVTDENKNPIIQDDKQEVAGKEYNDLLNEEFVLDILEGNKEKFKVVSKIVLDTDYKFGPKDTDNDTEKLAKIRQANDYLEWCEAFDSVKFED